MTSALFDEIAEAPEPPADDLFGDGTLDDGDAPSRTSESRAATPGKRGPRVRERECDVCGKTFTGGRKTCSDCKGTTPRAATAPRGNAKLEQELLESTVSLASDLSAVAPTLAGVLISRAEVAVQGMMTLSKGHPRVQKMLSRTASASKVADLMSTIAMVVVAAMVDFGRIPLESPLLDRLGYADIVRDDKGKAKRDPERGTIVKERRTLREIHDMMTGQDTSGGTQPPDAPMWNAFGGPTVHPDTGTGFTTVPPMNWTP